MRREGCHILIGTPGRLNDILSDPYSGVKAPNLSAFVLDEADRLLDQGFAPEIQNIERLLPSRRDVDRQTMLFSATVPQEVMGIVRDTMKRNFKFVRTVQEGEQQTHERIPQKFVAVRGLTNTMPALLELCKRELARADREMPFKAIVYFGATADVIVGAKTFENLNDPGLGVFNRHPLHPARIIEMHGRLSQYQRTKAANTFRRADSAIMFSSDVTARGMDFPNVTHVIQIGIPSVRETYIHRIGRTGRGDKPGEGWLLTADFEADDVPHRLHGLPIKPDSSLATAAVDMSKDARLPEHVASILTQIVHASSKVHIADKCAAYLANLGLYQRVRYKQDVVDALNDLARYCWAMEEPPRVSPGIVHKIGLGRVRGLNIGSDLSSMGGGGPGGYERATGRPYDRFDRGGGFNRSARGGGFPGSDRGRGFNRSDRGGYGRSNLGERRFEDF